MTRASSQRARAAIDSDDSRGVGQAASDFGLSATARAALVISVLRQQGVQSRRGIGLSGGLLARQRGRANPSGPAISYPNHHSDDHRIPGSAIPARALTAWIDTVSIGAFWYHLRDDGSANLIRS